MCLPYGAFRWHCAQGAYRDDHGQPVVLESVREAERRVAGSHFMEVSSLWWGQGKGKRFCDPAFSTNTPTACPAKGGEWGYRDPTRPSHFHQGRC